MDRSMRCTAAALVVLFVLLAAATAAGQNCSTPDSRTAPNAIPDSISVSTVGTGVTVAVLSNDVVDCLGALSITGVSPATRGSVVRNPNNTLTYTPSSLGPDSFTYTITDITQPGTTSTTTVQVAPPQPVTIVADAHGLDYLFEARPPVTAGILNYSWSFGNVHVNGTTPQINYRFPSPGTYAVSVAVNYQNGSVAFGYYTANAQTAHDLVWNVGVVDITATMTIDYTSLNSFPGGAGGVQVRVTFSDNAGDCVWGCSPAMQCDSFYGCRPVSVLYPRSGTYTVRLTVTDNTGAIYTFAKYVPIVNYPPYPLFSYNRDVPELRRYTFDPAFANDELDGYEGYEAHPYEWDFGDGTTAVTQTKTPVSHTYTQTGNFLVTLRLTDYAGEVGTRQHYVQVTNAAPVPKIVVNCRGLECTFRGDESLDDEYVQTWDWNFGDGTIGSGEQVTRTFTAGCYDVVLKATDRQGAFATTTQRVVAGPALVAAAGRVVVDAHVQSYPSGSQSATTSGNLNGILEPGETVVVEPTWPTQLSTLPVDVTASGWTSTDWSYARPEFRDFAYTYNLSSGTSDCWTVGRCYAVRVTSNGRDPSRVHNDIAFNETYLSNAQPTPGNPVTIHVGSSFTDVAPTHWAYASIESILHSGIAGGCGAWNYCPGTILTRAEGVVWALKAKNKPGWAPPACTVAPYNDVPCSHPLAAWIAQAKADSIADPDDTDTFRPDAYLNRGEAAGFVIRAVSGLIRPAIAYIFSDVPPEHPQAAWVSEIKRRNISIGCGPLEFCPEDPLDRAQAASFIANAFGIRLDTRQCVPPAAYDTVPTHPVLPPIVSLVFDPSTAVVGTPSTGTLTLGVAPLYDTAVPLSIDNPAAASIPSSVVVRGATKIAAFTLTPGNVPSRTPANVTAVYNGYPHTTHIDICTPPPNITVHPASNVITAGQQITLSVTASGGGALSYQWYVGTPPTGTPIGGNSSTLPVSPTANTTYWVKVTNSCGSTNSLPATVTVCYPPVITQQPLPDVILPGGTATLTVAASGTGPFTYQWYEGASGVMTTPAGTGITFVTPALTTTKSYWVRVSSSCNGAAANSSAAEIKVVTQIARRQRSGNVAQSLLKVTANWERETRPGTLLIAVMSSERIKDFTPQPGTGWQLATAEQWNTLKTAIFYWPNNPGGRTTEEFTVPNGYPDLTLQLFEYVAAVTTAPVDKIFTTGDNTPNDWHVYVGPTPQTAPGKELVLTALTINDRTTFTAPTDDFVKIREDFVGYNLTTAVHERIITTAGAYGHGAQVSGTGTREWLGVIATFKSATICIPPTITAQPASTTINSGQTATLSVTATSATGYQWYEGTNTPVGTGPSYTTPPLTTTKTYWVNVTNSCGSTPSATATVTVCVPPSITTHPASTTIASGATATLSVVASGTNLSYQWYEGANTPVGTGPSYTTPPLTTTKTYWVRVTSGCNGVTVNSNIATVTICTPPSIGQQPQSQTIGMGWTATLAVDAAGTGPLSYQWYQGPSGVTTTPVGANNAKFTTPALTATTSYWVRVTNACGERINSNTATITAGFTEVTGGLKSEGAVLAQKEVTATWPEPTHAGTLLVAVISARTDQESFDAFTPPDGWELANVHQWKNIRTAIFYYANHPGGRTSETFMTGAACDQILQVAEYAGIAEQSPLDQTAVDGAAEPLDSAIVQTGMTESTAQSKELVITALTTYASTAFSAPSDGFIETHDRASGKGLTTAVHERFTKESGSFGHTATVGSPAEWIGLVATFRSSDEK